MKKTPRKVSERPDPDRDTMRPEYDFSGGVRGKTAARYREGTSIVLLDGDVLKEFPTSQSVNAALRKVIRAKAARSTKAKRG